MTLDELARLAGEATQVDERGEWFTLGRARGYVEVSGFDSADTALMRAAAPATVAALVEVAKAAAERHLDWTGRRYYRNLAGIDAALADLTTALEAKP